MLTKIAILVADGFTDSGLGVAFDVFRTANAVLAATGRSPAFEVVFASFDGGTVRAASGTVVGGARTLRAAVRADVVLVPGLWSVDADGVDRRLGRHDVQALAKSVAAAHRRGAIVGSSCGGAFVLAEAGVLDDRACTTTWWLAPHLQRRAPRARVQGESSLVVSERVLTAGAVFAQADLTLHLVARFAGPSVARQCSRLLLLDRHPSQAPYMAIRQLANDDPTVRRAEHWIRRHLADTFDVAAVAHACGVGPRTLARRLVASVGLAPLPFVQRLRVEAAVHLLETTRLSLGEIGERVGYRDASALTRLVRRETGAAPREIRRRARAT